MEGAARASLEEKLENRIVWKCVSWNSLVAIRSYYAGTNFLVLVSWPDGQREIGEQARVGEEGTSGRIENEANNELLVSER